ncbi:MAG: trehalose-6-phosphate synthase [Acidobacteria bacterium]|nr:trehalose-6-phosphate synthase [Acidobacteriota bacterium]
MDYAASQATQIIVLSNREPYKHERDAGGRLHAERSSSGVVNAVEPVLLEHSGVWVAEGVGEPDREAAQNADGVNVPPHDPRYRLRRVWLTEKERQGYYYGFANGALWPLCHRTSVEPVFYATHFGEYEIVNRRFADAVAEEATVAAPVVLVQDYHFALAPALIRRQLPQSHIATFWHIPWPKPDVFAMCPWSQALLEGLLGSSVVGFQTAVDRDHFFRCVEKLSKAEVDRDASVVNFNGRLIAVGVYPASVPWPDNFLSVGSVDDCRSSVRRGFGRSDDVILGVGVDRLDYTKGLEQKFLAIERLLECRPSLLGKFAFIQVAEPSREVLPAYAQTRDRVRATAQRINERFAPDGPAPLHLIEMHHSSLAVARLYRAADLCYVSSLHDGMNLVSKEFVSARDDEQGVLVLSGFAGASHELRDAVIVNPYDIEQVARSMATAIEMPRPEQRDRMRRLRRVVARADASTWAERLISDALSCGSTPARSHPDLRYALSGDDGRLAM